MNKYGKLSHEEYQDRLKHKRSDVDVVGEYVNNSTPIMHRFLNCGHCYPVRPNSVLRGQGCGVCVGAVVLPGVNSLDITHPWLSEYFVNPDDMRYVSYGSNKEVVLKCPQCGELRTMPVVRLVNQGFACKMCGDGIKIPERFMRGILLQLGIDFAHRKTFPWSKHIWTPLENKYADKEYDFYDESKGVIIETHGRQHYTRCTYEKLGGRTLEQEQDNDRIKKEIAETQGLTVVAIDCKFSSMEYMQNSVIQSLLSTIYDLSNIDWQIAYASALKSIVGEVAELWNYGLSVKDIIQATKLGESTVTTYLKNAANAGLCTYTKEESWERGNKAKSGDKCYRYGDHSYAGSGHPQALNTVLLDRKKNPVLLWGCTKYIENELNIHESSISQCCNHVSGYEYVNNLQFRYLKDLINTTNIDVASIKRENFSDNEVEQIVLRCLVYNNCVIRLNLDNSIIDAWESPTFAASQLREKIKISRSAIGKCAMRDPKHKTAAGFKWIYLYDHYKINGERIQGAISLGVASEDFIYSIIKSNTTK